MVEDTNTYNSDNPLENSNISDITQKTLEYNILDHKYTELLDTVQSLKVENLSLTDEIKKLKANIYKYQSEIAKYKSELTQLRRMPLFVAVVIDKLPNNELYLRQQGNNQEYVTNTSTELYNKITIGAKVAVNNTLSVVRIMGNSVDSRIKVMELDVKPSITFNDIGGLKEEIQEVREAVEFPLTRPESFDRFGVIPPKGVLLYGPPGTGKTLIAKAVANNAGVPFIRMAGSELVHKYIGEGAQLVRDLFQMARDLSESNGGVVVFIDEIDAIGTMRTNDGTSGSAEVQRTMMQLLSELDGFNNRGNIRIMAATNRMDMLDIALIRPGRFDRLIKIGVPDTEARKQIFRVHTRKMEQTGALKNIDYDEFITDMSNLTEGMTGAEIEAICREAGMFAIRNRSRYIKQEQFIAAINKIRNQDNNNGHGSDMMYL
ncbi:MAG TPA: proteasome-activating nucleotidase [Methanocorpusculum sp.]|nr:proteasome-activating nucleotidase [Methanocorpusculum sp.]